MEYKSQAPDVGGPPPSSTNAKFIIGAAILVSALAFVFQRADPTFPASYALCSCTGKAIYTVDPENAQQQCLVVHNGVFVDTGDLDAVLERWHAGAAGGSLPVRYIDPGAVVVPGISDSHCHILEHGASRLIDLESATSLEETVARIAEYILATPDIRADPAKTIEAWGFDHASWESGALPHASDFDAHPITRGRRIIVQGRDGHSVWVSPTTLRENAPYPDHVEGGVIVRDADGQPTGVFMDSAMGLIRRPELTDDDLERRFAATVREALGLGLTALHDAGFNPVSLRFFKKKAETEGLPIRIYGMSYFNETEGYWGAGLQPLINVGDGRLTARSVKIFADGALRSGGAAVVPSLLMFLRKTDLSRQLYEPYADNPATKGVMRVTPELLNDVVPRFLRDGWQVNVHAIGDRANGIVLDAFEVAEREFGVDVASKRPRMEHVQIIRRADMQRLAKLGVIASIQPSHATSDMWYAEDRLGPERVKNLYAFRAILDSGARIALGTDFPVDAVDPLRGFVAALTRTARDGSSPHGPGGWFPEQRLTRLEALRGLTIGPAYASFTEDVLGSIECGKRADFVVLSQDIMTVPVGEILDTKVVATVIDGMVVHGRI